MEISHELPLKRLQIRYWIVGLKVPYGDSKLPVVLEMFNAEAGTKGAQSRSRHLVALPLLFIELSI
jgi:hypothetical protein